MEEGLTVMLGQWAKRPVTYAGGIASMEDLARFERMTGGSVDFTIGSALDLFGGPMPFSQIKKFCEN